ncbi:MAG TPA: Ig-like domain-containing protein [Bacteroidota bacterium]|nr:Ig-like domain-containing protein [Bacteroidota bacterium]
MRRVALLLCAALLASIPLRAQRTDLSGLTFCIDPGHGGYNSDDRNVVPDPGVNFWESESNFEKALLLRQLLWQQGATVILTRTSNDTVYPGGDDEPSLAARVEIANANNANWFHSIHSNAFDGKTNYTLVLMREDTASKQAASPSAAALSGILSPAIRAFLRTTASYTALDYQFEGFFLGVLSGLLMPGELSEGSFHDYLPECRRLLNNDYHKMEAYAIRNAFMQYFGVPADPRGIIAGIQTDVATGAPLNYTRVRLLPINRVYAGDGFHNGFFMFDSLSAGTYTLRFETPSYRTDSVQVVVGAGQTVFADRGLASTGYPTVLASSPSNGDTAASPVAPLALSFSAPMDTASVRAAFSIVPAVAGLLGWDPNNTVLTFAPQSHFPFLTSFTVKVDTGARSQSGEPIDGTGSGTPGNPFVLRFRTRQVRLYPPRVVSRFPDSAMTVATPGHTVNITFDEPLDPSSVTTANFRIGQVGGLPSLARTLLYSVGCGKGGVNIFVSAGLQPGAMYAVSISGAKDSSGNTIPNSAPITWSFNVQNSTYAIATIDSFDTGPLQWRQPLASAYTTGVDSGSLAVVTSPVYPALQSDPGAAALSFAWDTSASSWLLRTQLDTLAPQRSLLWPKLGSVLEAYVYSDGDNGQFRFGVVDSVDVYPGGRPQNHKVSRWYPLTWVGWRLLEWSLATDTVGTWLGGPSLGGQIEFDAFQLRYLPGVSATSGRIGIDQLRIARAVIVSVGPQGGSVPARFALGQNYPNPFNPSTVIGYLLPVQARVSLVVYDMLGREVERLVNAVLPAGAHTARWAPSGCASGVYFARMAAFGPGGAVLFAGTTKLTLLR